MHGRGRRVLEFPLIGLRPHRLIELAPTSSARIPLWVFAFGSVSVIFAVAVIALLYCNLTMIILAPVSRK